MPFAALINIMIIIFVFLIVCGAIWFALGKLRIAEPFLGWVQAILVLFAVLILLGVLFGGIGGGVGHLGLVGNGCR